MILHLRSCKDFLELLLLSIAHSLGEHHLSKVQQRFISAVFSAGHSPSIPSTDAVLLRAKNSSLSIPATAHLPRDDEIAEAAGALGHALPLDPLHLPVGRDGGLAQLHVTLVHVLDHRLEAHQRVHQVHLHHGEKRKTPTSGMAEKRKPPCGVAPGQAEEMHGC